MTAVDSSTTRTGVDAFAASVLVVLCLAWGLNQIAIKVTSIGLQPVFQAGLRSLVGTILVAIWCRYRGIALFERDGTLWAGLLAGLLFGIEFVLIFVGLEYTSASRAIIFIYASPFVVAIGGHFLIPGERLTFVRVVGLAAAFSGVVIAFFDQLSLPGPDAPLGDVLCLIAAVAWGATTVLVKATRLTRIAPEKTLLYQLAVSAVMMLALAPFFGPFIRDFSWLTAVGFAYQAVLVVSFTYVVWFWLLARYPAAQLASFGFLTPVFAVLFGGLLLDEPMSPWLFLALTLVALGIYLVNRPRAA